MIMITVMLNHNHYHHYHSYHFCHYYSLFSKLHEPQDYQIEKEFEMINSYQSHSHTNDENIFSHSSGTKSF